MAHFFFLFPDDFGSRSGPRPSENDFSQKKVHLNTSKVARVINHFRPKKMYLTTSMVSRVINHFRQKKVYLNTPIVARVRSVLIIRMPRREAPFLSRETTVPMRPSLPLVAPSLPPPPPLYAKVGLAIDSRGDVALAGHVFEDGGNIMDGRKDAIVMKLASADGTPLWRR